MNYDNVKHTRQEYNCFINNYLRRIVKYFAAKKKKKKYVTFHEI